jgi:hypothetical protein
MRLPPKMTPGMKALVRRKRVEPIDASPTRGPLVPMQQPGMETPAGMNPMLIRARRPR